MLKTNISDSGLKVTELVTGNSLILIFPEQVSQVEIDVWKLMNDKPYRGTLSYAGTRQSRLNLGKELIQ
jgi:hypothetical protein